MRYPIGSDSLGVSLLGFGQGNDGELYALGNSTATPAGGTGVDLKIVRALRPLEAIPSRGSPPRVPQSRVASRAPYRAERILRLGARRGLDEVERRPHAAEASGDASKTSRSVV